MHIPYYLNMPSLTVIRHSLTTANEQGLLMGSWLNSPLSEKGVELARIKGLALSKAGFTPDKIYTSKLLRTKQTAEIIVGVLNIDIKIIELEALNERDFGIYDGKALQELLDGFDKFGPNPPTVETVSLFVERIVKSLKQIEADTHKHSFVVTHNNPVNVMKAALFNPSNLHKFWETNNPGYCEGFSHEF